MAAIRSCDKCVPEGDGRLTPHAVCDLAPMFGRASCALKLEAGEIDLDDGEGGATVAPRRKKKPVNGTPRRRNEDRNSTRNVSGAERLDAKRTPA